MKLAVSLFCVFVSFICCPKLIFSQATTAEQELFESIKFRSIGPFRGGRSAAVTGVRGNPMLYYMGAAGGGVWRTQDAGSSWENISDGFFGGSIGSVAVAPSDANVIYVGGGEKTVRGNVSHGYGVWKSVDAGKTWIQSGLEDSRRIPRIRIHPNNPDIVYAAVLGHLFGPNQQRGVFRSVNGGKTWERILFVNDEAGAFDLVIDPGNPRVLYATTWKILRTPYSLESGGEGSGIWKSVDGGDTWTEITRNSGLPSGTVGICGIAVSPVNSNRVWAMLEAKDGGLFRSDDAGKTWSRINQERKLRQRAWYYSRVFAGPKSVDEVYVMNVRFWRSTDGGRTFASRRTPHSDHHDLWIDPDNADRMIVGDDGGAQVSFDRGATWSTYQNQPTSQFYRVTTDNHFPYRIYGAQQDNSTVRIAHRTAGGSISQRHWEPTAGGESGHIAPDPTNPEIVYGGSYGGYLTRVNHETGEVRNVHIWPDNPMGHGAGDGKYRFQWNFPIFFSKHDPQTLFAAGNVLFKTTDGGDSWQRISPDLTRNDPAKLGPSGGPITKDNTSVEYYCTIFAAAESLHEKDVIWVGSDDGLIHLTRDGGKNWADVTPPDMPEWMQINGVEPHPTEPGGLYVVGTRYKLDDFKPYLYKTTDYGKTWTKIVNGINSKHFTRAIRADVDRKGLLYAGTESGLYISFDDGASWKSFQCNLPIVPITDLAIKEKDLIVATQGRSFWVLDDLSRLHQWKPGIANQPFKLFSPRPTYRIGGGGGLSRTAGQNIDNGVNFFFWLKEKPADDADIKLEIMDNEDQLLAVYKKKQKSADQDEIKNQEQSNVDQDASANQPKPRNLKVAKGINRVNWNFRVDGAKSFDGLVLWGGGLQGPLVVPGIYHARLSVGEESTMAKFEIKADPRSSATVEDLQSQFDFLITARDKLTQTHQAIQRLRDAKSQIKSLLKRLEKDDNYKSIVDRGEKLTKDLTTIEKRLYQIKNQSPQDPLNFPIRLNNRLSSLIGVVATGSNAPTKQAREVWDALTQEIDKNLAELSELLDVGVNDFNDAVQSANVPAIMIDAED